MAGFDNEVIYGTNVDFRGVTPVVGQITTDGQLLIGSTAAPNIQAGSITSPDGSITIGYASPNITIQSTGSMNLREVGVDTATGAGTDPVVPTAGGLITYTGGQYATGTFGTRVITVLSPAANTVAIQAQISSAVAATLITKNGLCHFDSARFTVDVNGFVSINSAGVGETVTGDSGGALSPTAGNWNILGLSGSKTSGTGSTLTIKSPPFSQVGGSATSSLNTGEFVTAAVTRTLPASAGLADGDLFIYSCTTAGALVIQSVGAQKIRIGSLLSSAAGTATSTAIGDSLTLRFDATQGFFMAVSVIGTWVIA